MEQVSITSAYMWAFSVMAVFFFLAVIIANQIMYRPNNPGTTARRIWFWALCVATGFVGFFINYYLGSHIEVNSQQSNYYMHSGIAAGISVAVYILVGFIVSKIFPNSKVGTWF